jgi:hypothetical protein
MKNRKIKIETIIEIIDCIETHNDETFSYYIEFEDSELYKFMMKYYEENYESKKKEK